MQKQKEKRKKKKRSKKKKRKAVNSSLLISFPFASFLPSYLSLPTSPHPCLSSSPPPSLRSSIHGESTGEKKRSKRERERDNLILPGNWYIHIYFLPPLIYRYTHYNSRVYLCFLSTSLSTYIYGWLISPLVPSLLPSLPPPADYHLIDSLPSLLLAWSFAVLLLLLHSTSTFPPSTATSSDSPSASF